MLPPEPEIEVIALQTELTGELKLCCPPPELLPPPLTMFVTHEAIELSPEPKLCCPPPPLTTFVTHEVMLLLPENAFPPPMLPVVIDVGLGHTTDEIMGELFVLICVLDEEITEFIVFEINEPPRLRLVTGGGLGVWWLSPSCPPEICCVILLKLLLCELICCCTL